MLRPRDVPGARPGRAIAGSSSTARRSVEPMSSQAQRSTNVGAEHGQRAKKRPAALALVLRPSGSCLANLPSQLAGDGLQPTGARSRGAGLLFAPAARARGDVVAAHRADRQALAGVVHIVDGCLQCGRIAEGHCGAAATVTVLDGRHQQAIRVDRARTIERVRIERARSAVAASEDARSDHEERHERLGADRSQDTARGRSFVHRPKA